MLLAGFSAPQLIARHPSRILHYAPSHCTQGQSCEAAGLISLRLDACTRGWPNFGSAAHSAAPQPDPALRTTTLHAGPEL